MKNLNDVKKYLEPKAIMGVKVPAKV